jgi:hypothetical protein
MVNVDIYGRVSRGKNPHLHQVYLNITNPFDINTDHLDLKKVKAVYMDGTSDHFFDSFIAHYLNNKTVNGRAVTSGRTVTEEISRSNGKELTVKVKRGDSIKTLRITPIKDKEGKYKAGIWIRDEASGIGTVTYIIPDCKHSARGSITVE